MDLKPAALKQLPPWKSVFIFVAVLLPSLCFSLNTFAEEDIPIEGIVYESQNPDQSFASIEGDFYKKGSRYRNYEIMEIHRDYVLAKSPGGRIAQHSVKGGASAVPAANPRPSGAKPAASPQAASTTKPQTPPENPWEKFKESMGSFNPVNMLNNAVDMGVLIELRKLQNQATMAGESMGSESNNLETLIAQGTVDPSFKEGKRGYSYRLESVARGIQVYADPIKNPDTGKHFMIDAWGNVRVDQGKPASAQSPLYEMVMPSS